MSDKLTGMRNDMSLQSVLACEPLGLMAYGKQLQDSSPSPPFSHGLTTHPLPIPKPWHPS